MTKFSEYLNVKDFVGKQYHDLPLEVRVQCNNQIQKDVLTDFQRGTLVTDEVVKQVQMVYNEWWQEANPSTDDVLRRRIESRERDRILTLDRQIQQKKASLEKMNKVVADDGFVPKGERNKLKAEIDTLEKEMKASQKVDASVGRKNKDIESDTENWLNSFMND